MNIERVDQIARAVLYEGYMLYPYRPSSVKNRQRWNFGVLYPPEYVVGSKGSDASSLETEVLLETGSETELEIRVRFLHLIERKIGILHHADTEPEWVEALIVGDRRLQSWQETLEREVFIPVASLAMLPAYDEFHFSFDTVTEPVSDEKGIRAAVIQRSGHAVCGTIGVSVEQLREGMNKLRVVVENTSPLSGSTRDDALRKSLASVHVVLGVKRGAFVSLLEPPTELQGDAAACRNVGAWPVLVGEPGERDMMLVSPIILYDYPLIAPESAGDLFDGTEIDEILSLRIMTLTDEEKREMRQSDERARQILERTETLPEEQFMKLHGVLRGLRPVKEQRP